MNRAAFLRRLGLGALATLVAREATATTGIGSGAPDTADAVPAEPSPSVSSVFANSDGVSGTIISTCDDGTVSYTLNFGDTRVDVPKARLL